MCLWKVIDGIVPKPPFWLCSVGVWESTKNKKQLGGQITW